VTSFLLSCCGCACALDPSLAISQYAHTAWTASEGSFKGAVYAIAQTPDGYLWIGTEFGLLRFDGIRYVTWRQPADQGLLNSDIRSLLAARDGRLWVGTVEGLASWKSGKLVRYPKTAGLSVYTLKEDVDGGVWAAGSWSKEAGLCEIHGDDVQCYGEHGLLGTGLLALNRDRSGNLWAGGLDGLWRWKPGPLNRVSLDDPMPGIQSLIEDDRGALLIAMHGGVMRFSDNHVEKLALPGHAAFNPTRLLRDRDGALWIGTRDHGLLHWHDGRLDQLTHTDGLSADNISAIFEDREGSIWVATVVGLHRFRDFAVPTISLKQGLSEGLLGTVLAAKDGSVWLGTFNGVNRWKDNQITIYRNRRLGEPGDAELPARPPGSLVEQVSTDLISWRGWLQYPDTTMTPLFQDYRGRVYFSTPAGIIYFENGRFAFLRSVPWGQVLAMTGDAAGNLWFSDIERGLIHVFGDTVVETVPWAQLGHKDWALALLLGKVGSGLWLGFRQGDLVYTEHGRVRASYTASDGLAKGRVNALQFDHDGALWIAAEGGISRLKDGSIATLNSKNGLACDAVDWVSESDEDHSLWLNTACGVVRIAQHDLDTWITAVSAARSSKHAVQATVFNNLDGVLSHMRVKGYSPRVSKAPDGKLWFLPLEGVSIIDPRHLCVNPLPPPVHIEEVMADQKIYWQDSGGDLTSKVRLPPLVRDLEIDFTALSLVAPEKVHFRYRLEPIDRDWQDIGNRRQAFYTHLSPGTYRFHVTACNNSGLWNDAGASFAFSVAPAYYQSIWFPLLCIGATLMLLNVLHRLRLHKIGQEYRVRLEERVNERTRIARELHDTLLQGFHGLMFRFQAVDNLLPARPGEAQRVLKSALDGAGRAITEARDAVHELRLPVDATVDLGGAIKALGEELAEQYAAGTDSTDLPRFAVKVEGMQQDLNPVQRDEIYRITGEGLRNAFRHAGAQRIDVEIQYDSRQLRVLIRDNGAGIDPSVLTREGLAGHWGLPGMRERAKLIGGNMAVSSRLGAGTEVRLRVPASAVYQAYSGRNYWPFYRKMPSAMKKRKSADA